MKNKLNEDVSVKVTKDIPVKVVDPNVIKEKFSLNTKQTLDGDYLIFDHKDIDIVIMAEKKKVVAFAKDLMSEVVYGAESRLMEYLRKHGII